MPSSPWVIAFLVLTLSSIPASAATHLVKPDGTGDFPTIQIAIDASSPGDTILLAPGVFTGSGNKDLDFKGIIDLVLRSSDGPELTIIDCEGEGRGVDLHGGEIWSRIEGITIRNGNVGPNENGGGIRLLNAGLEIADCIIEGNSAHQGGGIYVGMITNPSFSIVNCVVRGNRAVDNGGGIHISGGNQARADFVGCQIVGNVGSEGGGISLQGISGTLEGCLIVGNQAARAAGLDSRGFGGELLNLISCTISGNEAEESCGGVSNSNMPLFFEKTILWGNCAPTAPEGCVASVFVCCDVDSSGLEGGNFPLDNMFADPLFCDPKSCGEGIPAELEEAYSLQSGSPCLPGSNECGELIGALPEGCPASSVSDPPDPLRVSWGRIKSAFSR